MRSVCTVRTLNLDGKDGFRWTGPAPAELGRGGGSVGEMRPATREGRRPGCEEERVRPAFGGGLNLGRGIEPTDATESAGDDERGVGGADDFALR